MSQPAYTTFPGSPTPLGATYQAGYTQFNLFSRHATAVSLLLFNQSDDGMPSHRFELDPSTHRSGDIWHIAVNGIPAGQRYGYLVDGPYKPEQGHRFNKHKLLTDPYAKALSGDFNWDLSEGRGYVWFSAKKDLSFDEKENFAHIPKSIVIDSAFDWEHDVRPKIPMKDLIVYEAHVRGFTYHHSSHVKHPGTYLGLVEKIPYLKSLGINAVELLPIHEFDHNENFRTNPFTKKKLHNYWGYSTLSFFAPKASYAAGDKVYGQVNEFKEMVKALHQAGIEVILDVVFNHTAEGNEFGPTLNFKGIDNQIYYMLENGRHYKNYSGCGNTFNCNHPVVINLILDCLRYWVTEMHVDGFRFDLASIMTRDENGHPLPKPPLIDMITHDPLLRDTKMIAEAWDASGMYQVGNFPSNRFADWNGKYRDNLRAFWRGDENSISELATRISGSSDLYQGNGKRPWHSVNFITCHDGFTLNDLVSYNEKNNLANGEDNRDGENHNLSFNLGEEGQSDNEGVREMRRRQKKNMLASILLSQGIPMLLAGDEIARTQEGNNNAWCQDNELSWINWHHIELQTELLRFVEKCCAFRSRHPAFRRHHFLTGHSIKGEALPDIAWYNQRGVPHTWDGRNKFLAFFLSGIMDVTDPILDHDFFIVMNAFEKKLHFKFPRELLPYTWKQVINTAEVSPLDFVDENEAVTLSADKHNLILGRSLQVFLSPSRIETKRGKI